MSTDYLGMSDLLFRDRRLLILGTGTYHLEMSDMLLGGGWWVTYLGMVTRYLRMGLIFHLEYLEKII